MSLASSWFVADLSSAPPLVGAACPAYAARGADAEQRFAEWKAAGQVAFTTHTGYVAALRACQKAIEAYETARQCAQGEIDYLAANWPNSPLFSELDALLSRAHDQTNLLSYARSQLLDDMAHHVTLVFPGQTAPKERADGSKPTTLKRAGPPGSSKATVSDASGSVTVDTATGEVTSDLAAWQVGAIVAVLALIAYRVLA
jgi:hypothetical protein